MIICLITRLNHYYDFKGKRLPIQVSHIRQFAIRNELLYSGFVLPNIQTLFVQKISFATFGVSIDDFFTRYAGLGYSLHERDGVINLRGNPFTTSSLVLLLGLISRFPTNELRVARNAQKRLQIDYDSVTMSKNALRIGTNHARFFESGDSWPKF